MNQFAKTWGIFCILLLYGLSSSAQFVNIPDTNFRSFLALNYPNAMVGNLLDTTEISITGETILDCKDLKIKDLTGIQYFDNLDQLNCSDNFIHQLPRLPNTITWLNCSINPIDSLPALPQNLFYLNCSNNFLSKLPSLPLTLTTLFCEMNQIDSLPPLPMNGMTMLECSYNKLKQLPTLPLSLSGLYCKCNQLSSLPTLPATLIILECSINPLYLLPTLPSGLINLICDQDSLTQLPTLPLTLTKLQCRKNQITSLPFLPNSLINIDCSTNLLLQLPSLPVSLINLTAADNGLNQLPTLPNTLEILDVSKNQLSVLPTLPQSLLTLIVETNFIPQLPNLPSGLIHLDYSSNPINVLPALPASLYQLVWNGNQTPILPVLPIALGVLKCNNADIDSLPTLPSTLKQLYCEGDSLSSLPMLPTGLNILSFRNNYLTAMPASLPPQLMYLDMANNLISTISWLPISLNNFDCSYNTQLNCLPKLPTEMLWIRFSGTGILCLPNYLRVLDTFNTSNNFFSAPLCMIASGCPCAWNITGNVHVDTSSSCLLDSLNPGNRVTNIQMQLFRNNQFLEQAYVTGQGEYSFDTGDTDSLDVRIDTTDLPFTVTCPTSGFQQVVLSPQDSMKDHIHFGVECNGSDAGIKSIMGRFRPGVMSVVNIQAGDMASYYQVHCGNPYSATVTLMYDGPVTYVSPAVNALSPTSINGQVLTYVISDLTQIDFNTAFGIELLTDVSAVIGNEVCISMSVDNVLNDIHPNNNAMNMCFPIVNSFDPNEKQVSPTSNVGAGQWLTYTIHFQNTGNDTAYKVVIRDTLEATLDPSTFKFLGSSHRTIPSLSGRFLTFYFNEINLLDSVHHEPESHGWVQFKIKVKSDLPFGSEIKNHASIYFDFNSPIFTNEAVNYIG
ncbi:MAG: DUF11 domain-containing protein, partial [Chitinophagaceae bacterium]|nr:DUF11 domain-containing protein [Chitinophagaceae bacterium]